MLTAAQRLTIRIPPLHSFKNLSQRDPITLVSLLLTQTLARQLSLLQAPILYMTPRKSEKSRRPPSNASSDEHSPGPSVPDSDDTTIIGGDSDDSDSEYEREYLPNGLSPRIYEAKQRADEKEREARKAQRMAEKGRLPRIEPPASTSQSVSPRKRKRNGGEEPPVDRHTTLCDPVFQAGNPLEKRIKAKARLGAGILDLFPATKGPNGLNRAIEPMQVDEQANEGGSVCPDSEEERDINVGLDTGEENQERMEFDEEIFGPAIAASQCAPVSGPSLGPTGAQSPDTSDEFSRSFQIGPGFLNQVGGDGIEI